MIFSFNHLLNNIILYYCVFGGQAMNDNIILYCWRKNKMCFKDLIDKLNNEPVKNYTISNAECLARDVLKIAGYANISGPIPIVNIAKKFGFLCLQAKDMPDDISGNIFIGGNTRKIYNSDKVIIVGCFEEKEHQRFIIAHELAHYLMDYIGSAASQNTDSLFSKAYLKQNHDTGEEIRADRFAAELLMPTELFLKQYAKAMERSNYNKSYTLSYLSTFFKTKKTSIEKRIDEVLS